MENANVEYFSIQRKMVATITAESWMNVPHISYLYEPDVGPIF